MKKKGICLLHIANVKTYFLHEKQVDCNKTDSACIQDVFCPYNSPIAKGENTSFDGGDELACIYSHFNRKLYNAKK